MNQHPGTRGAQIPRCHKAQLPLQRKCHFPHHSQKAEDMGMHSVLLPSHCRKADFKSSPSSQISSSIYNAKALRYFS